MARLKPRLVGLDPSGRRAEDVHAVGFSPCLAEPSLRHGRAKTGPRAHGRSSVVSAPSQPFSALAAYDAAIVAAPRERFLRAWLTLPGHIALATLRDGAPTGLGVVRPCRKGAKIGPLFADDAPTARALFAALI